MHDCDCNENMTNIVQENYNETKTYFDNISTINNNKTANENIKTLHTLRSFDDMNKFSKLETNETYKNNDGRIEITDLPSCTIPMIADYTTNINNMINDGNTIYQVMVKPAEHVAMIGNKKQHLKQVTWTKSHLNWVNEEIPLEIRLTHINTETYQITHVIFPVKLVDNPVSEVIEGFADGFFGLDMGKLETQYDSISTNIKNTLVTDIHNIQKITKENKLQDFDINKLDLTKLKDNKVDELYNQLNKINFNEVAQKFNNQKFTPKDINSLLNLNTLISDNSDIPSYTCCVPTYGKIVPMDLCPTATKVTDQETYHIAKGKEGSIVLITNPHPFNKKLGEQILSNLNEGDELI